MIQLEIILQTKKILVRLLINQGNFKTEENKIELSESNQRRSRKDMNRTKDRYKTNSYDRDCKMKKKVSSY